MRLSHLRSVAALLAVSALACSGGSTSKTSDGELALSASAIAGGQQIGIKEVIFVVSPAGALAPAPGDRILSASTTDGITYRARIGRFPVGSYTVFGYAYDTIGNDPRDPAQQPVDQFAAMIAAPVPMTVNPGLAASASLALQQNAVLFPPDGFANSAPFINFVTASSANVESTDLGVVGTVLNLAANVTDLDGITDIVDVTWSDNVGGAFVASGLPSVAGAISAVWTPPASFTGSAILTLAVTDTKLALSSLTITVNVTRASTKGGPVTITATINNWPDVTDMSVSNGLVLPGLTTGFSASAIDPDGDAVAFSWSSTCGGTFAPGVGSAPGIDVVTFTAPVVSGPCVITVNVTDGKGGSTSGQMGILVKQPLAYQPEFTTFDFAGAGAPGQAVQIAVEAVQYNAALALLPPLPLTAYTFSDVVTPISDPLYPATTFVGSWTIPAAVCVAQAPGAIVSATLNVTATGVAANAGDPIPVTTQPMVFSVTCP